jgi:hypothetical protein
VNDYCDDIKGILSRKSPKHPEPAHIRDSWKLQGQNLQFDDDGRRALAKPINDEILSSQGKSVSMAELDDCDTVKDLCDLVDEK